MSKLREIGSRIGGMFRKDRLDKELDEEVTVHLEMLVDENLRRGMTLEEAVLTLALGIGANTAIFSVLDSVMLQTLPVRDPQQLLLVSWTAKEWPAIVEDLEGSNRKDESGGWLSESVPYPTFEALRTQNTAFSEVFAFASNVDGFNVQVNGVSHAVASEAVSGNYFTGLRARTVLGRPILPDDDLPAAPPITVLSYNFWKRKDAKSPQRRKE